MKIKNYMFWGKFVLVLFLFCIHEGHAGESNTIFVGQFSQQKLADWQPKKFVDQTVYSIIPLEEEFVLKAVSEQAASGLIKKIRVDLDRTPFLNWRWRIENELAGVFDEKQKTGDDYAARIYVVVSGGFAIWNTKALNYVWAKHSLKGDAWPNAFAKKNAAMIALRSSETPSAVWHTEKRNIRDDFKAAFGEQIQFIDAVVLMSDTDNTQNKVTAYYGDIYFSSQ